MKNFRMITSGVALLLAAVLAYLSLTAWKTDGLMQAIEIGGPFELASANGGVVKSADLAGKPYGVFFGFTNCPEVCPTTMFEMSKTLAALGPSASDFRLFFVTVDPEQDTAEKLKDYLGNFDPRIEALVPTPQQLPEIGRAFRVIYEKVPTSDGGYTMNHTATVFLFGRDGKFHSSISYGEKPETREAKLRKLQ